MPYYETKFAVIFSGSTISSGFVAVPGGILFGLWAPTITSGTVLVQGAFAVPGTNPASANFVRLQNPAGSGDWTFAAGLGSKAVTLQDPAPPWPFLRLETSVAQTDTRTFAVIVKVR
jgi:hypothetical protein